MPPAACVFLRGLEAEAMGLVEEGLQFSIYFLLDKADDMKSIKSI